MRKQSLKIFSNKNRKTETKHSAEDYMKKFCSCLKEHASNTIDLEKQQKILLTKKVKTISICNGMLLCRKTFKKKVAKDKNEQKVRGHCHYLGK